jgi:PD-(D/E)XK nuclease superfamily
VKLRYDDANHAYWLDGKRCRSISAVAKIPDDTYSLEQWRKRQILVGVATLPGLVERAAAHFDDRDALDRIAEEALTAARSHEAAAHGTAAHRITERIDLGEMILDSPQARAVRAAWQEALGRAGLVIVPELVERIVLYPERRIVGRFDRIARREADDQLVVLDIKTGTSAVRYPHAVAVQLALYAYAPLMAAPLPRGGGTTEVFEEMADVDRSVGYMVHMADDDKADVLAVDLEAGWRGAQASFGVLDWRAEKALLTPVTQLQVAPVDVAQPGEADPARVQWITERLKVLGEIAEARRSVADLWPAQVPPRSPWSDEQIDQIAGLLTKLEGRHRLPFGPLNPAGDDPSPSRRWPWTDAAPVSAPPPLPAAPDDGPALTSEQLTGLVDYLAAMPDTQRCQLRAWAKEAADAERPWAGAAVGLPTRHEAVTWAAVAAVEVGASDEELRSAIATVTGLELHESWPTAALFGCLSSYAAGELFTLLNTTHEGDPPT